VSVEAVFDQLDAVMTRWSMGGQAASLAPSHWKEAIGGSETAERELRLLALTGQFLSLCVVPTPSSALTEVAEIPPLPLPVLPATYASLARRCLVALKESHRQRDLIHLLATRGYAIHPADWMPSRHDDAVPDAYAPWRDWAEAQASQDKSAQDTPDILTESNWADWWPAARRIALAQIRAREPAQATALLAARAASESADVRLALIQCLISGLSDEDVPYLETLSTDRAPKIKALAASLLARLGRGSGSNEDATELAGFFEFQTKGLLRRTRILMSRPIKTPAQRSRREALFAQIDFVGFARALGLESDDLVSLWPFGSDGQADIGFATLCEQSATDAVIAALCARLMRETSLDLSLIFTLRSRLNGGQRDGFARRVLAASSGYFRSALAITGAGMDMEGLIDTAAGRALVAAASGEVDATAELHALGLIASQASARAAIERFTKSGLMASDPRLDLLRLNAALTDNGDRP
jgi:Family of unknown function (DUF5691)